MRLVRGEDYPDPIREIPAGSHEIMMVHQYPEAWHHLNANQLVAEVLRNQRKFLQAIAEAIRHEGRRVNEDKGKRILEAVDPLPLDHKVLG